MPRREVQVRGGVAVSIVADHGVPDHSEMPAHLVLPAVLGVSVNERMTPDDVGPNVARTRFLRSPVFDEGAIHDSFLSRDAAEKRDVLLLAE